MLSNKIKKRSIFLQGDAGIAPMRAPRSGSYPWLLQVVCGGDQRVKSAFQDSR